LFGSNPGGGVMGLTKEWWMAQQDILLDEYNLKQITREQFIEKLDKLNAGRMICEREEPAFERDRWEFENAQS